MAATFIGTRNGARTTLGQSQTKWREKLSEYFWLSVCLVLFLILGPFAAPIVLGFLFSNQALGVEMLEPETAGEN